MFDLRQINFSGKEARFISLLLFLSLSALLLCFNAAASPAAMMLVTGYHEIQDIERH